MHAEAVNDTDAVRDLTPRRRLGQQRRRPARSRRRPPLGLGGMVAVAVAAESVGKGLSPAWLSGPRRAASRVYPGWAGPPRSRARDPPRDVQIHVQQLISNHSI